MLDIVAAPRRSLVAATVAAGLLALTTHGPGALAATRTPAPHVGQVQTGVLTTAGHRRVLIVAPTTYDLRGLGIGAPTARVNVTLRARVRLPHGRALTAVDTRQLAGASLLHVRHHAYFGARDSATILRAARRAATGGPTPRISVTAHEALDVNADGRTDASSTRTRTLDLPQPSNVDLDVGSAGQPVGTDPCGYFQITNPTCVDVAGSTWEAEGFLYSHEFSVPCPPNKAPEGAGEGRQAYMIQTHSTNFETVGVSFSGPPITLKVTLTDYNLRDHPWGYTPYVACITINSSVAHRAGRRVA